MALVPCASAHCSGIQGSVNEVCKSAGWPVSHPVIVQEANGNICYCTCSCLAFGTPVQDGDGEYKAIEMFQVGDSVLAAGLSLRWEAQAVEFSAGTTGASRQKYTVLVVYDDTAIAVTSDHLFLMSDRVLRRADRLTAGDKLVNPKGEPIEIKSVHIGDYLAGFHHIATKKEQPKPDLENHLINTNGVISGDYAVQLFARDGSFKGKIADHDKLAIVGSPEYTAKYGPSCLQAPALTKERDGIPAISGRLHIAIAGSNTVDSTGAVFVPAEKTILAIPADAARFISDAEATQKALDPHRAWNDPLSREWTEYLLQHHGHFYPNIQFHLDWADNTVNAYAWIQNGVRHVAIKGGLVRHNALELEGIALVIAHEIGHHYGGPPTFPGGLSCEGQADYSGVRDIMRLVWFSEQYTNMSLPGIQQMANFFGVPNSPNAPTGSAGCNHPPGRCRVAAYHAAVRLTPKPGCAS